MTNHMLSSQRLKTKKVLFLIRHSRIESVPIPLLDINYAGSKATLLLLSCYLALLLTYDQHTIFNREIEKGGPNVFVAER